MPNTRFFGYRTLFTIGFFLLLVGLTTWVFIGNRAISASAAAPRYEDAAPAKEEPLAKKKNTLLVEEAEETTEVLEEGEEQYKIKPDDILEIKMFPDPDKEISGDYKIRKSGTMSFPLLGDMEAAGLTEEELAQKLTFLLEKDYFVFPQVNVRVTEYHKSIVVVLGEVKQPGTYEVETAGEFTLLRAISLAGGFTDIASLKNVKIIRREGEKERTIKVNVNDIMEGKAKDIQIKEDDVIIIGESFF